MAEDEYQELGSALEDDNSEAETPRATSPQGRHILSDRAVSARSELRTHELLALLACFAFPALGAWLLHAIRSQLSRPSEGLVSDYNLTIFILAAEVRPLSHLIKLVQRRTLFLQRTISASASEKTPEQVDQHVAELTQRLEDLEAHIANSVLLSTSPSSSSAADKNDPNSPTFPSTTTTTTTDDLISRASTIATHEIRKTMQPELDALNRAMRRYEKRFTISATQIETRLHDLEARMQDTIILAAATQRNANKHAGKYAPVLLNWVAACVVVPVRYVVFVATLPQRAVNAVVVFVKGKFGMPVAPVGKGGSGGKDGKMGRPGSARRWPKEKSKTSSSVAGAGAA